MTGKIRLREIFRYFLYLGVTGFGGPLAIIEYMRRDLVLKKKWISHEEFSDYFGYSQIAPGPLAFQVALYISYFKRGFLAAILSGIGIVLPSYILVLLFSVFYKEFSDIETVKWALYGISPAIVAIVFQSGYTLSRNVFNKQIIQYVIFFASAGLTIFFGLPIIYIIIGSALFSLIYFTVKDKIILKNKTSDLGSALAVITGIVILTVTKISLIIQNSKTFISEKLLEMALLFMKVGSLTYGSGFVIVGVLRQEVVDKLGWLTAKEFLDGIAFGQITPGPVVITSTFIGYMTSGFAGSLVATVCIFLPTFFFVMIIAQGIEKLKNNFYLKSLIKGANAAAIGAILSTAYLLSKDALIDYYTAGMFLAGLGALLFTKLKPYYLIIFAALAGILIKLLIS